MKIAVFITNMEIGGAERVTINLIHEWVKLGHSIDLLLVNRVGDYLTLIPDSVNIYDLQAKRLRNSIYPLVQYLSKVGPDALLACHWPLTSIAVVAAFFAKIFSGLRHTRLLLVEHTTWSQEPSVLRSAFMRSITRWSMRASYPYAHSVIAVSKGAAQDLANFARVAPASIHAIYNPVTHSAAAPSMRAKNYDRLRPDLHDWWNGDHKKIVAVGKLIAVKDHATLLRAFAQLRQSTSAKLLILGEGQLRAETIALVKELALDDVVYLPGFVANPLDYNAVADLHVLSSVSEGLPTVLIEALEAGVNIAATDCAAGVREILLNGLYGRIAPPRDPPALALAMQAALREPVAKEKLQARAQDFSIEKASQAYLQLLKPQ